MIIINEMFLNTSAGKETDLQSTDHKINFIKFVLCLCYSISQ